MEKEKRRALILYATMTSNTEKVANWFAETFDAAVRLTDDLFRVNTERVYLKKR